MSTNIYERLAARLGPKGYSIDAETIAPHLVEWRGRHQGSTPLLVMPASTEEVAAIVTLCAEARVAVTPQGGNTGLVGGQIPQGEVLLSLKRMNKIRSSEPIDDALTVEAGVVLKTVQEAAAAADRLFPLSLGSEGTATIGGLISTNAGGVHVLRYGMMRDLVLGIEAVLPDGHVLDGLKTLRKDNTGYDLKQLFIGGEGTLGVVTAASLKLFPRPRAHLVALASVASAERALDLLHRVKGVTGILSAFEIMNRLSVALTIKNVPGTRDPLPEAPYIALLEFESVAPEGVREAVESVLGAAIEAGEADDVLLSENEAQAKSFWSLRELVAAGHKPEGAQVNHDVSVPVSRTPAFLDKARSEMERLCPGARIVAFGHMGDGNFHYSVLTPIGLDPGQFPAAAINDAVHEIAVGFAGSISAEHGIGVARRADLARFKDPESIRVMRAVKAALDPRGVMNPRVLLP
jgi:FAD/FMN-containing dehydrogenase